MAITRIWQTGWETGSLDEALGSGTISTTFARTGTYSRRLAYDSPTILDSFYFDVPATRKIRIAGEFYFTHLGDYATDGDIIQAYATATRLVEIKTVKATNDIALLVDGSQKDVTTNSPLSLATWHHFVLNCNIDPTAGWAYVYLNGEEILSFDGNTGNVDVNRARYGAVVNHISGSIKYWYVDDCYVDDLTGESGPTSGPILRFYYIKPDGNGNYNQWLGSDGNNVDNYLLVDEIPPAEADYVEEDTVDQFDSYAMTSYTLGGDEQIEAVIPIVYAQRYGAAEELAIGTRYAGTDLIGSDQDPGFGAWKFTWERQAAKPGGGVWNQAALDDVEVVIKSRGVF